MAKGYFVTGTDTNVGKTWATVALMLALQRIGKNVVGMKPVAAGCEWREGAWKNQDALLLQQYASRAFDYRHVNPYAFPQPVSPHIACGDVDVEPQRLWREFQILAAAADCVLVEGAGGWFSPLGTELDNAGLAEYLDLPVIVVVGMRLGCINHARLTVHAVREAGLQPAGWLAVALEPDMSGFQANVNYLQEKLRIPFLGTMPHLLNPGYALLSKFVNIEKLNNL